MSTVSTEISKYIGSATKLAEIWGSILFNVKDTVYAGGAKGNGTADDTAAIQSTIDYAISVGGKAIFFPHGTYKVTALTNLSSVVLFGDNASFVGISNKITQLGAPTTSGIVYNVKDYGAKGDGATDDTTAINAALQAAVSALGGVVSFPFGTYAISNPLIINQNDITIEGNGSTILNTTANKDTIQLTTSISRAVIRNITLSRNQVATGGVGLYQLGTVGVCRLENVISEKSYYGFYLKATDTSVVYRCIAQNNTSHGFYITPNLTNGAVQWNFQGTCVGQVNGGDGLRIEAIAEATVMPVGSIERFDTYGNGGYGIAYIGSATCPIQGIRLQTAFLGDDALGDLYLDTYGGDHVIGTLYCELCASHGVYITANNKYFTFVNVNVNGHKKNGIYCAGSKGTFNSIQANNNGYTAVSAADRIGVNLVGDDLICNTVFTSNRNGATYQDIGIKLGGNRNIVTSLIAENNVTSQYSITNPSNSIVKNGIASQKKVDIVGSVTASTYNGSNYLLVPHGLGVVPSAAVIAIESGTFVVANIFTYDAANIYLALYNDAGVRIITGSYKIHFSVTV